MLPSPYRARLTAAFTSAFDVDELAELYRTTFDSPLNLQVRIDTLQHAVEDLFALMDRTGQWAALLHAAHDGRPHHPTLVTICKECLGHLSVQTEAAGAPPGDPLRSTLLLRNLPFVDRDAVREAVAEMDRPDGWSGLLVKGPPRVGKTYLHEFLNHMRVHSWGADRIAQVILQRERDRAMQAVELARRLALGARPGQADQGPPQLPGQKEERWAADLAVWLAGLVDLCGCRVWVVLAGFDHPDVPPSTHELIAGLAEEAARRAHLRLVLLGYAPPQPWPDHIERSFRSEDLGYLSAVHLRDYFAALDARLAYRRRAACAAAATAADRLVELYGMLPEGDPRQAAVLRQALPGVVRELVRAAAADRPAA